MSKDTFVKVPTSIIGQSLVQQNYPLLCYTARDLGISISLRSGTGILKIECSNIIATYLEKKLSKMLSSHLRTACVDVYVRGVKGFSPMDALIAIASRILENSTQESSLVHRLSRSLATSSPRVKAVLESMKNEGLMAYREGEGLVVLQKHFPWSIALCLKPPFRFKIFEVEGLEGIFDIVVHALGRTIIVVARSIMDGDFKLFRKAISRYSRICMALSNTPLSMLKAYERLSSFKEVACKVDEDFRGFMLFSEERDSLRGALEYASAMGFQVLRLEG